MPPALDPTPGGNTANSYGSLAEAVAYFSAHPNAAAWDSATSDQRTVALLTATRRLDQESYVGSRASASQALAFPRDEIEVDGVWLSDATVPDRVKWAQFEEALAFLQKPARGSTSGLAQFKNVSVGPLSVTPADQSGPVPGELCPEAARLIRPFLGVGPGAFPVVRG